MAGIILTMGLGSDARGALQSAPAGLANDNPPSEQELFERCVERELAGCRGDLSDN